MTHSEFMRLRAFQIAHRNAPRFYGKSKRQAKKPVQVLKHSRVEYQVPIERIFIKR